MDLIGSEVPVSDKVLAWLVYVESLWQLLPPKVDRERVPSIVGEVDLSDLDSVVS